MIQDQLMSDEQNKRHDREQQQLQLRINEEERRSEVLSLRLEYSRLAHESLVEKMRQMDERCQMIHQQCQKLEEQFLREKLNKNHQEQEEMKIPKSGKGNESLKLQLERNRLIEKKLIEGLAEMKQMFSKMGIGDEMINQRRLKEDVINQNGSNEDPEMDMKEVQIPKVNIKGGEDSSELGTTKEGQSEPFQEINNTSQSVDVNNEPTNESGKSIGSKGVSGEEKDEA